MILVGKSMERDFLGRSSGKFAGVMEYLKGSPVFPDRMFQTIPFSGFQVRFSGNGTDLYKWLIRFRDEITSPEFCLPFTHTVNRPDCP